jgi:surface antigen
MDKLSAPLALAIALATSSCATHEQAGAATGAGVGAVAGNVVTQGSLVGTLIGAAVGAAVGADIGRQMDEEDREQAAYALEYSETGEAHEWTNPDTGREYAWTPTRTYDGPEGPCRDFVMLTSIDGEPAEIRGTACRAPDGTWRTIEQ